MSELEKEKDPIEKIPAQMEDEPCGYFEDKTAKVLLTSSYWFEYMDTDLPETAIFGNLLGKGFRRCGAHFYVQICEHCAQCTPIRVPVEKFRPSKSQRAVWRKNQDLSINICSDPNYFYTEEKAFLYREYDNHHNGHKSDYKKMSIPEAAETLRLMNSGYCGILNMEYRYKGKLIGVAILDYSEDKNGRIDAVSSNYFYYDISDEVLKRSIGVFSVLKEIELCHKMGVPYYYLGLYLPDCRKMNYKTNYEPYELLIGDDWLENSKGLCKTLCDMADKS